MFNEISELKAIREEKLRLLEREAELLKPILRQVELLPTLFEWFIEIRNNMPVRPDRMSVRTRKQFLFIILWLYSPATLSGGRLLYGLRRKLVEVFHVNSRTIISDNCSDVVFYYQQYKDFRIEVDYIRMQLLNRLRLEGIEMQL